jgi:hypothetical protein
MDKDGDQHQTTEYIWFGLTPPPKSSLRSDFRYLLGVIRHCQ